MQQLLEFKVDVNAGDYDLRTALHLAATEGKLTVVAFLVSHGANVNVKDRWNSTPLEDAIRNGFKTVAHHLRSHGGKVDQEFVANLLCEAASTGNLVQLQMLVENGVDANVGDYDMRTAVHLAAAEGQLLALNFLVNVGNAHHSPMDRWESTPLSDALSGGHEMCTHLLLAEGATLGPRATDDEKEQVAKIKEKWNSDGGAEFFKAITMLRSQIANHIVEVQKGRARSDIFDLEAAMKFNKQMLNRQVLRLQSLAANAEKLRTTIKRMDN
jgi:ankyrin repeat protein